VIFRILWEVKEDLVPGGTGTDLPALKPGRRHPCLRNRSVQEQLHFLLCQNLFTRERSFTLTVQARDQGWSRPRYSVYVFGGRISRDAGILARACTRKKYRPH